MATPPDAPPIALFERFGVELEYMIIDRATMDVRPIADEVIRAITGAYTSDAEPDGEHGEISWSNELVAHVIELKTQHPAASLAGLGDRFHDHVQKINAILEPMGARLLPTAMHPWMDPHREAKLWPHEYNAVYEKFNSIFSCKGHGWSNLQSTHINLPFANDEEFGRLHAAIRVILALVPAIAASSPFQEGRATGIADTRLDHYRVNSARIPSMTGLIIPESVHTRAEYEQTILERIYRDLAPHDPEGILRYEWANARGCIARFDRGAIEIRVVDVQECPRADLAIVGVITHAVRGLVEERWSTGIAQRRLATEPLHEILKRCITEGEHAMINYAPLLEVMGLPTAPVTAGGVWAALSARAAEDGAPGGSDAVALTRAGTLSSRMRQAVGETVDRASLGRVCDDLADCLARNEMFGMESAR